MTPEEKLIFFKKKVIKTWLQKGKSFMQEGKNNKWPLATPAEGEREIIYLPLRPRGRRIKKCRRKHKVNKLVGD